MVVHTSEGQSSDSEYVRAALIRHLPECRPLIEGLERAELEAAQDLGLERQEVGIYSLISEAFVWPVLVPALERQLLADPQVSGCAHLIEELVSCARSEVRQAMKIRVIELLAGTNLPWVEFSKDIGPVASQLVDASRGGQ